jgi:peptide/nickel transport system permease protein
LRSFLVRFAVVFLIFAYSLVVFADYLAPYDPTYQNPAASYAKPSKIHFDLNGLYVYQQTYYYDSQTFLKKSREITDKKYYVNFFTKDHLFKVAKPAQIYILGADQLGRDLFSRIIHGSRPSLTIGFIGLLIAFPIGILYGALAAYSSKPIDDLMMRLAEAVMTFPSFYLLIILSAVLPASLTNIERFALITVILSLTSWAGLSRVIRGQVLSIRNNEYIQAAKLMGISKFKIITRHLVPQTFSYIIIAATLAVPGFIIGESALSFLGLGINQPDASWGNILAEANQLSNIINKPLILFVPAGLIFLTILSYNTLGDFLRDKFDPASK